MWKVLVMGVALTVAGQKFDPSDESDYVDNIDEYEPNTKSVWVSDIVSTVSIKDVKTKKIQDEIEKLLGQQVFQYEGPGSESWGPGRVRTRFTKSFKRSKTKSRGRLRIDEPVYSVRVPQWADEPKTAQKRRPGVIESLVNAHDLSRYENPRRVPEARMLGDLMGSYENLARAHGHPARMHGAPARTDGAPARMHGAPARTDGAPARTHGAPARTDGAPARMHGAPARTHGGPTRTYEANRTAYNEGGFRYRTTQMYEDSLNVLQNPDGRRYLVTVPGAHLTFTTRRPRPTPVSFVLSTQKAYTRKTQRHPNCTDSYYDCLLKCFDRKGYRVRCPWDTTTRGEPNRLNFTGLFHAVHRDKQMTDYDVSNIFWSWKDELIEKGYRSCRTFTTTTTTLPPLYPVYYDEYLSNKTGTIVAKCWVCGLTEHGIPRDSYCADNFGDAGSALALAEKATYRRYCRYMDEVPLWFNKSDPFAVYGPWTGGCTVRWLDLTGLYTQRACRSKTSPATGNHYLSKRMASLELSLMDVDNGCIVSPMATLVPFSRAISLYARFHVCVCRGTFCNQASHKGPSLVLMILPSLSYLRQVFHREA